MAVGATKGTNRCGLQWYGTCGLDAEAQARCPALHHIQSTGRRLLYRCKTTRQKVALMHGFQKLQQHRTKSCKGPRTASYTGDNLEYSQAWARCLADVKVEVGLLLHWRPLRKGGQLKPILTKAHTTGPPHSRDAAGDQNQVTSAMDHKLLSTDSP